LPNGTLDEITPSRFSPPLSSWKLERTLELGHLRLSPRRWSPLVEKDDGSEALVALKIWNPFGRGISRRSPTHCAVPEKAFSRQRKLSLPKGLS